MKKHVHDSFFAALLPLIAFMICIAGSLPQAKAQIYEPEGLNLPGAWNSWTNPPSNNLALASSTQVTNGRVVKKTNGTLRWQTVFNVAATGADLIGGTYNFLFTSGPATSAFQNKWAGVTVTMNTLQSYTYNTGADNSITITNGKWYTMNWEDIGYVSNKAIFMETSSQPVEITNVSTPSSVAANQAAGINITISAAPCAEELFYLRYSTDNWASSSILPVSISGTSGTASIPGQPASTVVKYYVLSSTVASLSANYDLCTIKLNNNTNLNYTYTVAPPPPTITWANLQFPPSGTIVKGGDFTAYGQVLIPGVSGQGTPSASLQAWVGYSSTNTDPATWTNWVSATYNGSFGNNDEYMANIGPSITTSGTYYYATRFQLGADPYVYGGYNGGYWNGTTNVNGTLTVNNPVVNPDFDWVNLQYPGSGAIQPGQAFDVYAQDFITGVTGQATPAAGVQAWIGYSTTNTDPSTWTNWVPATYNAPAGNNDEYKTNLGALLTTPGTYYYASRFQKNTGTYFYGGYSISGGGIWNGSSNISGEVIVSVTPPPAIDWANLQYPAEGTITLGDGFDVFGRVYVNGVTGLGTASSHLAAWVGYSTSNTNPNTWTNWVPATFNISIGNNDEYQANIGSLLGIAGTYYYATRFQNDNGAYVYGGYNQNGGGFWDGTNNLSGMLTVNNPATTYPVTFTITDATFVHQHIKFKGQMTNWDTVAMAKNGNIWTLTLNLAPGSYEWGAIEDDGSASGLWLIQGPNLIMNVDNSGNVTGVTSYTTYVTGLPEWAASVRLFPNPAPGFLQVVLPLQQAKLRLFDFAGRVVLHANYSPGMSLDLEKIMPGVYSLEVVHGNEIGHFKVIKSAR